MDESAHWKHVRLGGNLDGMAWHSKPKHKLEPCFLWAKAEWLMGRFNNACSNPHVLLGVRGHDYGGK